MIRIAVTAAAFEAIAATLPLGSVAPQVANGERLIGRSSRASRRCAAPARATTT